MVLLYGKGKHQLGTCADDEDSCMYGKRGYTVLNFNLNYEHQYIKLNVFLIVVQSTASKFIGQP